MLRTFLLIAIFFSFVFSTIIKAQNYELMHTFNEQNPPGNIAVSPDGRIFMSQHFFYGVEKKVVEVLKDGSVVPYPSSNFSQSLNPVLGIVADEKGILWMLETAEAKEKTGRLIGWDINKNVLYKEIYLGLPLVPENSFLNDLAIDRKNNAVYITDTAGGDNSALLVVNLKTGKTRRVLEGSQFTKPEDIDMVIDNKTVTLGQEGARIGVNPITIDTRNEWVYFAPMTGLALYRIKTIDLLNEVLTPTELINRVEFYGAKPISDGITIDDNDNIYITDITQNAVGYINAKRQYQTLFADKELASWPDGFANGTNNDIYVTINKLHKSPVLNNGKDTSAGKYYILRFDGVGKTSVGR